jgi:TPP-dependent pyruvate/acetoin dehydrogenase alpha subunit
VNPQDLQTWGAKDPILRFRNYLLKKGVWDAQQEEELVARTKEEIQRAIDAAEAAGALDVDTLVGDVYAEVPWHLQQELRELKESVE